MDIEELKGKLHNFLLEFNRYEDTQSLWMALHSPLPDDDNADITELIWEEKQKEAIWRAPEEGDELQGEHFPVDPKQAHFAVEFGRYVRNLLLFHDQAWKVIEGFSRKLRTDGLEAAIEAGKRKRRAADAALLLFRYLRDEGELPAGQQELGEYALKWGATSIRQNSISRGLSEVGEAIKVDLTALIDGRMRSKSEPPDE